MLCGLKCLGKLVHQVTAETSPALTEANLLLNSKDNGCWTIKSLAICYCWIQRKSLMENWNVIQSRYKPPWQIQLYWFESQWEWRFLFEPRALDHPLLQLTSAKKQGYLLLLYLSHFLVWDLTKIHTLNPACSLVLRYSSICVSSTTLKPCVSPADFVLFGWVPVHETE